MFFNIFLKYFSHVYFFWNQKSFLKFFGSILASFFGTFLAHFLGQFLRHFLGQFWLIFWISFWANLWSIFASNLSQFSTSDSFKLFYLPLMNKTLLVENKNGSSELFYLPLMNKTDFEIVAPLSGVATAPPWQKWRLQTEKMYHFWSSPVEKGSPSTIWGVEICCRFLILKLRQ